MASPTFQKIIGVKVETANEGETVILRNNTSGEQTTGVLNAKFEAVFKQAWAEGDKLIAEIRGSVTGLKAATISTGGANIRIAASADTSSPGVSL